MTQDNSSLVLRCKLTDPISDSDVPTARAVLSHQTAGQRAGALSATQKEVLKSVLTSSYINLPQASIFLHSSVLYVFDVSQHLCLALRLVSSVRLPDSRERALRPR